MKAQNLGFLFILFLGLYSCERTDVSISSLTGEDLTLKSTTIANADILAESVTCDADYEADYFTYAQKILKQIARTTGNTNRLIHSRHLGHYYSGEGPSVSIDTTETGYPVIITLDYGDSTVLKHGQVLSGIIVVEISGDKKTDGAYRTVTYNGFSIDTVGVEGSVSELYSLTSDSATIVSSTGTVILTLPDGGTITRRIEKQRMWIEGIDTPLEHSDDVLQVTGKTETSTSAGESFIKEITEPLIKSGDCRHFVQGTVQFVQDGVVIAVLDYGDGECDNIATLTTADGESVEIELNGKGSESMSGKGMNHSNDKENGKGKGKDKGNGKGKG